ncbi:hypothetical protein GUJ93_ZPchr0010g8761 [Zizania palustris]|uniref:Uncharacterized protein n=1 Tax=Zizania palustris TaxID=103762 RepID=A0A8J5WE55_ZIZPA|nr:hypothetical protein GUJ93_ZPchr0010g8761 [Zizania palustris]
MEDVDNTDQGGDMGRKESSDSVPGSKKCVLLGGRKVNDKGDCVEGDDESSDDDALSKIPTHYCRPFGGTEAAGTNEGSLGVDYGGHGDDMDAEFLVDESLGGSSEVGGSFGVFVGLADGQDDVGAEGEIKEDLLASEGLIPDQDGSVDVGGSDAVGSKAHGLVSGDESLLDTRAGRVVVHSVIDDGFQLVGPKKNSKRKVVKGPPVVVRQSSRLKRDGVPIVIKAQLRANSKNDISAEKEGDIHLVNDFWGAYGRVSDVDNSELIRPFSLDELDGAVKGMRVNTAGSWP